MFELQENKININSNIFYSSPPPVQATQVFNIMII